MMGTRGCSRAVCSLELLGGMGHLCIPLPLAASHASNILAYVREKMRNHCLRLRRWLNQMSAFAFTLGNHG